MKQEKQVVSLELSKKLDKLLGDKKPESLFVYRYDEPMCVDVKYFGATDSHTLCYLSDGKIPEGWEGRTTPAYTVAELGEMLPQSYKAKSNKFQSREICEECGENPHKSHEGSEVYAEFDWVRRLRDSKTDEFFWQIRYSYSDPETGENEYMEGMNGNTEADARAKMLIYLIENKLITPWINNKK